MFGKNKLEHLYSYSHDRQIWRLLISRKNQLLIEERNMASKEVFFNCLDANSGKYIFRDLQLEEKFWTGIEAFEEELIFFHGYAKPDMPGHLGISAYGMGEKRILWSNPEAVFDFLDKDRVYAYVQKFEGRQYYALDNLTGKFIGEIPLDEINELRELCREAENLKYENYCFPEQYYPAIGSDVEFNEIIGQFISDKKITGAIEFMRYSDLYLFNFFYQNEASKLSNSFMVWDTQKHKKLLEKLLNDSSNSYVPDSFFIKDGLLFILKGKNALEVYKLNQPEAG